MIEEVDFETYLYVSKDKFQIFVYDKLNQKNLFNKEIRLNNQLNFHNLDNLTKFLDENIFKIEKLVKNFIKNIILIIENDDNLQINISIKKKNYESFINQKYLENNLIELKDLFKENYQDQSLMHMLIINYIINGKKYSSLSNDLIVDHLCIEVGFVSISNDLTLIFDKLLEKYQIKISQYMCGNYIKSFLIKNNIDPSLMAHKLKNGFNDKEVILIPKNTENEGFFEKFFQLFS